MAFLAPLALSFAPAIIDAFKGIFTDEEEENFEDEYEDDEDAEGWFW